MAAFGRRHYEICAIALKRDASRDALVQAEIAKFLADLFETDNTGFSRGRFYHAAGVLDTGYNSVLYRNLPETTSY